MKTKAEIEAKLAEVTQQIDDLPHNHTHAEELVGWEMALGWVLSE